MEQIQKQNYEEKFKMYNKLSKKELVQMLIQANEVIARQTPQVYIPMQTEPTTPVNPYPWSPVIYGNTQGSTIFCNKRDKNGAYLSNRRALEMNGYSIKK